MSLQKTQSRVCSIRNRTILNQEHTAVMSKRLRKNILLCDLLDDNLYLLCVISIFATFEIGGYLRS